MIGALNRGKCLTKTTIELMREAALSKPAMTKETRTKISANSAIAELFKISTVDSTPLKGGEMSIVLRTILSLASYCNCSEKTVRPALKSNGILKKNWLIIRLGKANKP